MSRMEVYMVAHPQTPSLYDVSLWSRKEMDVNEREGKLVGASLYIASFSVKWKPHLDLHDKVSELRVV